MSHRISCFTLFDITQTGVLNRARPSIEQDHADWLLKRNTQCNFDTILQSISLRSLPEVVKYPEKKIGLLKDTEFGETYKKKYKKPVSYWEFEFEIPSITVFHDDIDELGNLYKDVSNVPMILVKDEIRELQSFLDTTKDLKNIYFVKY